MTRVSLAASLAAGCVLACMAPTARAQKAPAKQSKIKAYILVFDFTCDQGTYGAQISDSLRLRLRRHKEYDVMARVDVQDLTKPYPIGTDQKEIIAVLKKIGMTMGIYGTVTKSGPNVTAEIRCVDLSAGDKPVVWTQTFSDSSERARGEVAKGVVEKLRGQAEWVPPQYGDEEEPKKFGPPINKNGGFERGHLGWDRPDNVSTFIEDGPSGRGKILRVRTDLARDPWLAYRRKLRFGQADPSNPPKIRRDTSYGSVAGLEGVHYRSDWITPVSGQRYWMTADANKCGGTPKIFVKGFLDWSGRADGLSESSLARLGLTPRQFARLPEAKRKKLVAADVKRRPEQYRRECYRWYLNLRGPSNQWHHYAAVCPPRGGLPENVQWLQLQVYSYWPPGTYLWDNVHFYKDPRQKAPATVEKARTPNFGKTSDIVERLYELKQKIKAKQEELKQFHKGPHAAKAKAVTKQLEELKKRVEVIEKALDKYRIKDSKH